MSLWTIMKTIGRHVQSPTGILEPGDNGYEEALAEAAVDRLWGPALARVDAPDVAATLCIRRGRVVEMSWPSGYMQLVEGTFDDFLEVLWDLTGVTADGRFVSYEGVENLPDTAVHPVAARPSIGFR